MPNWAKAPPWPLPLTLPIGTKAADSRGNKWTATVEARLRGGDGANPIYSGSWESGGKFYEHMCAGLVDWVFVSRNYLRLVK